MNDFEQVGPGLLSTFDNIVHGNAPGEGPDASPDQTEYNLTGDYHLNRDWASGIWIRIRGAQVDQDDDTGVDDYFDFRNIINFGYDLLQGPL